MSRWNEYAFFLNFDKAWNPTTQPKVWEVPNCWRKSTTKQQYCLVNAAQIDLHHKQWKIHSCLQSLWLSLLLPWPQEGEATGNHSRSGEGAVTKRKVTSMICVTTLSSTPTSPICRCARTCVTVFAVSIWNSALGTDTAFWSIRHCATSLRLCLTDGGMCINLSKVRKGMVAEKWRKSVSLIQELKC